MSAKYQHYDKFAESDEVLFFRSLALKWYRLAKADEPVPANVNDLARRFVENELAEGRMQASVELGFVILHRCQNDFYFLLVSTWQNGNELWESVLAKTRNDEDFAPFTFDSHHRGTFCIWELAIVWHERQEFRRFVLGEVSREAYLQNRYRGEA